MCGVESKFCFVNEARFLIVHNVSSSNNPKDRENQRFKRGVLRGVKI
jgi:hypothetical protein